MIEGGGVPSESGKRGFFANEAFFLKVGRETLDDTRVGEVRSRLSSGVVEGPALAYFADGIRTV